MREESRETRAEADRDREDRKMHGRDALRAMHRLRDEGGQQRGSRSPQEPENARDETKPPELRLAVQLRKEGKGRSRDVDVDFKRAVGARRRRDEPGARIGQDRKADHAEREIGGVTPLLHRNAAEDRADKDRNEGRGLDERIAFRQFVAVQAVRQHPIFRGAEKRAEHAKEEEREEQRRDGAGIEARDGDCRRADFGKLQPARDLALVEFICEFAAERREEEIGRHESRGRERDERGAALPADAKQDEHR